MITPLSIEDVCKKLRPILGKKIDDIYLKYALAEKEEKEEIIQLLNALYNKNLGALLENKVLLEPPAEGVLDGDYTLADVSYAGKKLFPFNLREKDWQRHVCISGMSGSGKTTLAFNILMNFIRKEKPFLVFDWKKSFRPLLNASSDIFCFTIGNDSASNLFRMNINNPPKGIDPKEWINILCDLLVESFAASFGVHKVLLETLDEAFSEWGIYEGSENYPTWEHIKWRLEEKSAKVKGRESGWVESALRIASVLTFGNFGKVCNHKGEGAIGVEDLFKRKVVLELSSLSNVEKKFFCEFILTYVYKLKKALQEKEEGFEYAILVDEAHNIFLKQPTTFTMESVTDMVYREMREYGISLICLDQHISKLSDTIKGNSACHIAFQQQLPQDVYDISSLMQMREQKEFFTMLPVGSAIVRLAERYTFPFLIQVSKVKLKDKEITDQNVQTRASALVNQVGLEKGVDKKFLKELIDGGRGEARRKSAGVAKKSVKSRFRSKLASDERLDAVQKELYNFVQSKLAQGMELRDLENLLERKKEKGGFSVRDIGVVINYALENQMKNRKAVGSKNLSEGQKDFMDFLNDNTGENVSVTEIYNELGLTPRRGNDIKNALLEKGLIKIEEVRDSKGRKKFVRLS